MTTTAAPNRRQAAKARMRERILNAARAEFAQRGYTGATTRGIADRAHCSTGALYNSWPDGLTALWHEVTDLPVPGALPPTYGEVCARRDLALGEGDHERAGALQELLALLPDEAAA